jgi:hypothetical protein
MVKKSVFKVSMIEKRGLDEVISSEKEGRQRQSIEVLISVALSNLIFTGYSSVAVYENTPLSSSDVSASKILQQN